MDKDYQEIMYKVNCLSSDLNSLYHQAALKLGMSDTVMILLYMVYDRDGRCPLKVITKEMGLSKQTVNSALRKLEKEEVVYLEQAGGRTKDVCLTPKGQAYAKQTVGRLFNAECTAFNGWEETDIQTYLTLMEKYNQGFRRQIEEM